MKIKIAIIFLIIIVSIAIILIVYNNNSNNEITNFINIINNNSILPIPYMNKYDKGEEKLSEYQYVNNYMSDDYYSEDIVLYYYGYPDDESEFYLGKINLLTSKYNILGITIGSNMNQSITKLEQYGFTIDSETENNNYVKTLKYKKFTIDLEADIESFEKAESEITVGKIKLEIDSKYLGNRLY